jgi:SAM-dependent methyltransferase
VGVGAAMNSINCRLCGADTIEIGHKLSAYSQRQYAIRHCPVCHFSFVADPWTEFEKIYSAEYYAGRGADPLVDYVFELEHPDKTIRTYEWAGILEIVGSLIDLKPNTQWLDFGCGNGGLVRYVREHTASQIVGFDEGWICDKAAKMGIPYLAKAQLDDQQGQYDIITAIEVLEHTIDPLATLQQIRRLLKPGGIFFCTTGNAQPFRDRLLSWKYVVPDIHVSFFEPSTLSHALTLAGFQPEYRGFVPGFANIIRFKVLKNLGIQRRSMIERLLPWNLLARLADARLSVTAHPIGLIAEASTTKS